MTISLSSYYWNKRGFAEIVIKLLKSWYILYLSHMPWKYCVLNEISEINYIFIYCYVWNVNICIIAYLYFEINDKIYYCFCDFLLHCHSCWFKSDWRGTVAACICLSVHPVTLILHLSKHAHHKFELESLNLNETCILAPLKWVFNSLWPNDATWRHRSGSRLAQVMACCLMAPSHYLSQCWLIISKVPWHSSFISNQTNNTQ